MVNFLTRIPGCDRHSPALLDLFVSSHASFRSTMTFALLGNFDHLVVSVSIDFLPCRGEGEVSNSVSTRGAQQSNATTIFQNKQIFLSTLPRTGFSNEVSSYLILS